MTKPRKPLTHKQEIQEEPVVIFLNKVQDFYKQYAKPVQYGALALVAIIVISTMMVRSKREAERKAAGQLGIAENYISNYQWSTAVTELKAVKETFPGTPSAGRAIMYLAKAALEDSKRDEAKNLYKEYIDNYSSDAYTSSLAMAGYAGCLEDEGNSADAMKWYEKAFNQDPKSIQAPGYLKAAGRCAHTAGQPEKMRQFYQRIVDDYADSAESQEVKVLLSSQN